MKHALPHRSSRPFLLPFCAFCFSLFLWAAITTFDAGDWPSPLRYPPNTPPGNTCGVVGAWWAYQLRYLMGYGAYPLLLFVTWTALERLVGKRLGRLRERLFGLVLVIACTSAASQLVRWHGSADLPVGHGGLVGFALGRLLTENLDRLGTGIVLVATMIVGLLFATEGWVLSLPAMLLQAGRFSARTVQRAREQAASIMAPRVAPATEGITAAESEALLQISPSRVGGTGSPGRGRTRKSGKTQKTLFEGEPSTYEDSQEEVDEYECETGEKPCGADRKESKSTASNASKSKKAAKALLGPRVNFPTLQKISQAEPYPRQIENWTLPSLDLLQEPGYSFTAQQEVLVREQAKVLERTLEEFRLDARVVEIDTGPVITMFELKIGAGIKVAQIASLSNDIARALKAHAIRVVAPISGKNTVGIEVPNVEKEQVRLKELIALAGRKAADMGLPLFLGKDAGGAALVADLTKMPHALIAGTTGSGKSVCLNAVILSLLMTKRPDHVKMILIDPKMVEMSQFKDVPHLMCPIVTDMIKAEKILEWAVTKMEERYEILAEARVKDISSYNRLGQEALYDRIKPVNEQEKSRITALLPLIVIVIDELADLMMTSAKEVEHNLSRLAQKSRAVGIHIVVATQRPEAKVVTGLIKSNLPSRICFRVASRMDSRIVLDQNGGEVLLGQGDMLFLPPGSHKLIRAQGTFLDEREVQAVLEDLASRAKPEFHPELIRIRAPGMDGDLTLRDPLFDDAVEIILQSGRGSVSLLQRRLSVGYSRASRLIDQMGTAGIVGEYKGSQAREVLITADQWEAMKAQLATDLEAGYEADVDAEAEDDAESDNEVPSLSDNHDIYG